MLQTLQKILGVRAVGQVIWFNAGQLTQNVTWQTLPACRVLKPRQVKASLGAGRVGLSFVESSCQRGRVIK